MKYLIVMLLFVVSNIHAEEESIQFNKWRDIWDRSDGLAREKLLIDFFYYSLQPVAINREKALSRIKIIQSLIANSEWKQSDSNIKDVVEKAINEEVVLLDAAICMNIPEWCGTRFTKDLTGDNIAILCTHRTFKINGYSSYFQHFNPEQVKFGDSIFVVPNYLDLFFDVYHQDIKESYVLVTHNSDMPIPGKFIKYLDDEKIIAWFSTNLDGTKHLKLNPLPLGMRNHGYGGSEVFRNNSNPYRSLEKKFLAYLNFSFTHPERQEVFNIFDKKKWCTITHNKKYLEYVKDVAQSKFVISPRGAGLDCWRTWEALFFGSFPIVKRSPIDSLFKNLPVVIVDDWNDITEEFLESKYVELSRIHWNNNKLFADYWGRQIALFGKKTKVFVDTVNKKEDIR